MMLDDCVGGVARMMMVHESAFLFSRTTPPFSMHFEKSKSALYKRTKVLYTWFVVCSYLTKGFQVRFQNGCEMVRGTTGKMKCEST